MFNQLSIEAVKKASFSKRFCRPLYESYCFSNIPNLVESLLFNQDPICEGVIEKGTYDQVIFLFVDGFGWEFFEKYLTSSPSLQRLAGNGIVSKFTSMFPSTTAAHVTCIHTDEPPGQSGIYEWNIYDKNIDEVISPLPFSFAGEKKQNTLTVDPKEILPQKTFYERLGEKGITSYCHQDRILSESIYGQAMQKGAKICPHDSLSEGLDILARQLLKKERQYHFFYIPTIDSVGHRKGVYSPEFSQSIHSIFSDIEKLLSKLRSKSALLVSADHGMVRVNPSKTYYLNKEFPSIAKFFCRTKKDRPIVPAGSCRDFFLHITQERLGECKEILTEQIGSIGEVHLTKDLIDQGFFSKEPPSKRFLERVGNLVLLPYEGEGIWWYEKGRFSQNFEAAHGGLTRSEMEIPFIFFPA